MKKPTVKKVRIELRRDKYLPSKVPELKGVINGENPFRWETSFFDQSPIPFDHQPIKGGYSVTNGPNIYNHAIAYRQSCIFTGDKPIFRLFKIHAIPGYHDVKEKKAEYPILGNEYGRWCQLGKLRVGIIEEDKAKWVDEFKEIETFFYPGNTQYKCLDSQNNLKVTLSIVPFLKAEGAICRLTFESSEEKEFKFIWTFGGICQQGEKALNKVAIKEGYFELKDGTLPKAIVYAGSNFPQEKLSLKEGNPFLEHISLDKVLNSTPHFNQLALSTTSLKIKPNQPFTAYILLVWGIADYDKGTVQKIFTRLDNINCTGKWKKKMKEAWFDNYIGRALNPEEKIKIYLEKPEEVYKEAKEFWLSRSKQLIIKTPDERLNALASYTAACSDYCYSPPSHREDFLVYTCPIHLSMGNWYGKEAIGDHSQIEETLRFYGTFVDEDGYLRWVTQVLVPFRAEEDGLHWVDQVYNHYCWTGDKKFVREVWPIVRKVVDCQLKRDDPDGDGLCRGIYEFWWCDSWLRGPKVPSTSCIVLSILQKAAELGKVAGDLEKNKKYALLAKKAKKKIIQELWMQDKGILAAICPLGIKQIYPGGFEIFLPINFGTVDEVQAYQMLRFIRENLHVKLKEELTLQLTDNKWPIVWSYHSVIAGDAFQTILASCKGGDIENYYPILDSIIDVYFNSSVPPMGGGRIYFDGSSQWLGWAVSGEIFVRCIVEGLFGIKPKVQENEITITPTFPSEWNKASIKIPDIEYSFQKEEGEITVRVKNPQKRKKILKIGTREEVKKVLVNGKETEYITKEGVNRCYIVIETPVEKESVIEIKTTGRPIKLEYKNPFVLNTTYEIKVKNSSKIEVYDPQEAIRVKELREKSVFFSPKRLGNRTFFLKVFQGNISFLQPVDLRVKEGLEISEELVGATLRQTSSLQDVSLGLIPYPELKKLPKQKNNPPKILTPILDLKEKSLKFKLVNNYPKEKRLRVKFSFSGETWTEDMVLHERSKRDLIHQISECTFSRLTPGKNLLKAEIEDRVYRLPVINWNILRDKPFSLLEKKFFSNLITLDLRKCYNASMEKFLRKKFMYDVGWERFPCFHGELPRIDLSSVPVNKTLISEARIPFLIDQNEMKGITKNILVLANWRPYHFPTGGVIFVGEKVEKIYLLVTSYFYPQKCYLPNGEIIVHYEDGSKQVEQLVPPYNMDVYFQHFSLEGSKTKFGHLIDSNWSRGSIPGREAHADVIDFLLDSTKEVKKLEIRSVCTESIIGIMGITLVRNEER